VERQRLQLQRFHQALRGRVAVVEAPGPGALLSVSGKMLARGWMRHAPCRWPQRGRGS
jgi:hypothetical protein